jgi:SAM-dependent methyltransferase
VNGPHGEPPTVASRESPAAERNKQPIAEVLARVLPTAGVIFEVASGTGRHIEHFARVFAGREWQPSEPDEESFAVLAARVAAVALPNLRTPILFDVLTQATPLARADAVLCSNMIHIAPWPATEALLQHAARLLVAGAPLVLYGPFKRGGQHTAPSNAAFDASLRARNAAWGVRDLDDVAALASRHGFELAETVAMPANNLTVIFRRGLQ